MAAIASRYARAFADVVFERKLDAAKSVADLHSLTSLVHSSSDLRKTWDNPSISAQQKHAVLDSITARLGASKEVRNFLAVVIEKELRSKRNGGSFLSVRLADRIGELDAKAWDNPEAVAQLFDCNDVVKVRGAIEHYNDKPQLIVSRIRRCEAKEYTAADFYAASHLDPEEMFGELETFVAMVRDEPLRQLLESIVNDTSINQRLKTVPAAMKIHHAFRGGLLEHVLSLCNLAAALTAHYPRLNLDWLIAGAILHEGMASERDRTGKLKYQQRLASA